MHIPAYVLQDIKFPMMLDVYDMCTPELQEKLVKMRTLFKEQEDRLAELKASVCTLYALCSNNDFVFKVYVESVL